MRCVARNKQKFFYALYEGVEEVTDENGFYTGARKTVYGDITEAKGNISPTRAKSDAFIELFGTDFDYESVILMESSPINENSIVWLGVENPTKDNFNYTVKRVAQGLHSVAIAVKKVD